MPEKKWECVELLPKVILPMRDFLVCVFCAPGTSGRQVLFSVGSFQTLRNAWKSPFKTSCLDFQVSCEIGLVMFGICFVFNKGST